jgi:predicted transcriptional regulator
MKHDPLVFDIVDQDADERAARDGEAGAGAGAGRVISQAEMAEGLKTWGTPDKKPGPARWLN